MEGLHWRPLCGCLCRFVCWVDPLNGSLFFWFYFRQEAVSYRRVALVVCFVVFLNFLWFVFGFNSMHGICNYCNYSSDPPRLETVLSLFVSLFWPITLVNPVDHFFVCV